MIVTKCINIIFELKGNFLEFYSSRGEFWVKFLGINSLHYVLSLYMSVNFMAYRHETEFSYVSPFTVLQILWPRVEVCGLKNSSFSRAIKPWNVFHVIFFGRRFFGEFGTKWIWRICTNCIISFAKKMKILPWD